ncbi:NVEALA domain-containing protein [Parabacteroides sp.]|uniref:NVEALA domain-containing protein n=1 Tax=Parabacteroides sp. TaxID=1869337 RepID=UPI00257CCE21|nr:NVEALA domain-containing protein [Parabacteroides sp.]
MNKKSLFISLATALVTTAIWYSTHLENDIRLTDLTLDNVEALASGEAGGKCTGPKSYGECESRNTNPCSDTSGCNS